MSNGITTKTGDSGPTLKSLLLGDKMREQFQMALPKHLTPDRFCRIALTALLKTPKLAQCTQESFFQCLLQLAGFGLEPDGRRAHLIPFKNTKRGVVECTLILDYKGMVELAKRSGDVDTIYADIVCENDRFEFNTGEVVEHVINFRRPRGEMYAAYAICKTKDGGTQAVALGKDEIDAIRARSISGNNGPWVTDYNEMAKKTAFRRLSKWLTLSPEFRDAIEVEDEENARLVLDTESMPSAPARSVEELGASLREDEPPADAVEEVESVEQVEESGAPEADKSNYGKAVQLLLSSDSIETLDANTVEIGGEWEPHVLKKLNAHYKQKLKDLSQDVPA